MSKQRKGHILVIDDSEIWCAELVELLQGDGFLVDAASTVTEALARLNKTFYHLIVLDIRMDEADQSNQEGMDLLRELDKRGLSNAIKVIVLSVHDSKEYMRPSFTEYKVVDFQPKDEFDTQKFLEIVRQTFAKEVNINLGLEIVWQPHGSGPEPAVLDLNIDKTPVKRGTSLQKQVADELDDLLCRLFYQAESVLVRPLTAGHSGTRVLSVQPFFAAKGVGHEVVVKFGDFRKIEVEYNNFKEYVQPFVGGGRNTTVLDVRRTSHLGGIIYSLLGTSNDELVDFGTFYYHADVSRIRDALDRLFRDTCGAWYADRGRLQALDLTADYQRWFSYTTKKLEQVVSKQLKSVHVKMVQGKRKLSFTSLNSERTFTNALQAMAGLSLVRFTYTCITHGDFNQHNLLVDSTGNIWLIDFQSTGQSHILRDLATLDSAVRFQLLAEEEATLKERLQMEEALCSIERFSQMEQLASRFSTRNPDLAKAYATVVHLRSVAHKLVEHNPTDDISEYYIALFYNALNTLRFSSLPTVQREHALLCASLLADRLGLSS